MRSQEAALRRPANEISYSRQPQFFLVSGKKVGQSKNEISRSRQPQCLRRRQESGRARRLLKNLALGRRATRTLSTVFPNSRGRRSLYSARGILVDARAYIPDRDGGLREKACSRAFPRRPAKGEPSRLGETSPRDHCRRALPRASPCSERRSRLVPHGPAAACSASGPAVLEASSAEPSA